MKSTLQLCAFVLLPFFAFCQQYDLQLGGYYLLNNRQVNTFDQTSTFTFPILNSETLGIEQTSQSKFEQVLVFNNKGSFSVGVGRTDTISKRLTYRLGLDVHNQKYRSVTEFNSLEFNVISSDTVLLDSVNPILIGSTSCDITETSIADVMIAEEDLGTNYNIYLLGLSGELAYSLIPETLNLGLGVSLRSPLYSNVTNRVIIRTTTEENDLIICNHEQVLVEDKTGNYFRNMQVGATISLDYKVWNNLVVSVGVYNAFSDFFSYGEVTDISTFTVARVSPSIQMKEGFIRVRQIF